MKDFLVSAVVDGDTFDVRGGWTWNGQQGDRVRPTGYNTPELWEPGGQQAKAKLTNLILNKTVQIGSAYKVDRGRLVADVSFNGYNIADYFPEYKT